MLKQTIVWTALPHGIDGAPDPGATVRISAFVAPRLWNDDGTPVMKLAQFPDFLDWPQVVRASTFKVAFGAGTMLNATVTSPAPDSTLWAALFKDETDVLPFAFEDLSGAEILTFSAVDVHRAIVDAYQDAATNPVYHGGSRLPATADLAADPGLDDIRRPVRPEPPWVPADKPTDIPVRPPEPPPPAPPSGCLGCLPAFLLIPIRAIWQLIRKVLKWIGLPVALSLLPMLGLGGGPGLSPGGGGAVSAKKKAFDDLRAFVAPTSGTPQPLPTAADLAATYDFHKMIAALGDYPLLLRRMGLVVDLDVTVPAGGLPANDTIRIAVTAPLTLPTTNYTPRTHYALSADLFVARPRQAGADLSNGLLRLQDPARFAVQQVDVASSGIKLQNAATNIVGLKVLEEQPVNSPAEQGLPALATGGISIVRPDVRSRLREAFERMYAFNRKLASADGSPVAPLASGAAPPPDSDELFAEDVTRGYRIDIRDSLAQGWLSLCQRRGKYAFLDAAAAGTFQLDDEGFVQPGATEPLAPSATRVLRAHETLFTWDGWSLAAPRPGEAILPETGPPTADEPDGVTQHGVVPNTAATPFRLETTFEAVPGTLPRLRYGHSYRVRGRVVDLAGNSVFEPGDPAFGDDQPEVSAEFVFRRFEPVGTPPVLLRTEPKEGESLERLTVRSAPFDPDATIRAQTTERHLAPPKGAQLLAERHAHFDAGQLMRGDAAAYDRASREAGSLTHRLDLATNKLLPITGVKKVEDATLHRTYWLQENDKFEVSYLPDPFSRGVLLRGLPGMAGIDDVQDNINRLPFDGPWPVLKPLRLRLRGIPRNAAPAAPAWDATDRVLDVELPQGETVAVLLASYFEQADLEQMGVWDWTVQKAPPDLAALRTAAIEGRNWLHLPYRTLTLVHAVQQPLEIPKVSAFDDAQRQPADTSALINGTLALDAKSTGKIDVWASWSDPLDDPDDPANDPATARVDQRMLVRDLVVPDPANDAPTFKQILDGMQKQAPPTPGQPPPPPPPPSTGLRHTFGDTKHHTVTYRLVGTTRFREHFPPAIADDPVKLVRPLAETADPDGDPSAVLEIPSSARPAPLRPVSILPTFHWDESTAGTTRTRTRRGGGLRVYVERAWWSSGDGEQVGVLVKPAGAPMIGRPAETLQKYTSEWAMDPLWAAATTSPLKLGDFDNGTPSPQPRLLAELAAPLVGVVGFAPEYDSVRKLWFADIQLDVDDAYFPFVRLALARYQPISIDGAHLSPVVLSDFVQVVPHRWVDYDLASVNPNGSVGVRLRGPGHHIGDWAVNGATVVAARLERREHGDADAEEPVGWTAVKTVLLDRVSEVGNEVTWEGVIPLGANLPSPLRVSVIEAQVLRSGSGDVGALFAAPNVGGGDVGALLGAPMIESDRGAIRGADIADVALGYRTVFADTTVIN